MTCAFLYSESQTRKMDPHFRHLDSIDDVRLRKRAVFRGHQPCSWVSPGNGAADSFYMDAGLLSWKQPMVSLLNLPCAANSSPGALTGARPVFVQLVNTLGRNRKNIPGQCDRKNKERRTYIKSMYSSVVARPQKPVSYADTCLLNFYNV